MAEYNRKDVLVNEDLDIVFNKIEANIPEDWQLLYENRKADEADLVYLSGMFSGAGFLAMWQHGARKSIVYIKLAKTEQSTTQVVVITGGSESIWGTDYGRFDRVITTVLKPLVYEETSAD